MTDQPVLAALDESVVLPRILFGVTSDQSIGLLRGFPELLDAEGWDVHVASNPGKNSQELSGSAIEVHSLEMVREPSVLKDMRSLVEWIVLLVRLKPDLVSVGTPKAGLLGSIASRIAGVRHRVYVLRGLRLETKTGMSLKVLTALERLACTCATEVLTISPSLRDEVVQRGLASSEKVRLLGHGSSNGVDTRRFKPGTLSESERCKLETEVNLRAGVPVIGFVGRQTRDKGLIELASASKRLLDKGIQHQVLVVGAIDEDFPDPWQLAGMSEHQRPSVVGSVDDVAPYYQLMDVLAFPTHREGFGNVSIEAGASAVPVVTTTATGARDTVRHGETGFIVPVGNDAALAHALETLLTDPVLRQNMGRAGREFVKRHYEQRDVWARLLDFYSSHQTS